MSQVQFLSDVDKILIQTVFWISVGFVVGVSTFWPWWKTDLGWTIVLKTAAIAALLLPANLHDLFGIQAGTLAWAWWVTTSFASVGIVIVWRFIVMYILQRYNPPPVKSGRKTYGQARNRWKTRKHG
jgi:hypothetical protein